MQKEPVKIPLSDFKSTRKEPKRIPLKSNIQPEKNLEHEDFEKNNKEGLLQLEPEPSH